MEFVVVGAVVATLRIPAFGTVIAAVRKQMLTKRAKIFIAPFRIRSIRIVVLTGGHRRSVAHSYPLQSPKLIVLQRSVSLNQSVNPSP